MSALLPRLARVSLAVGFVAATVFAVHDDDPKILQRIDLYDGPGWSSGGAAFEGRGGPNASSFAADGVELLSFVSLADLGITTAANDCWGYVSPSGREYAILCTEESTEFIEVTDPAAPVIVDSVPGPVGIWRDAKIYGEYCYSVHESDGVGIQVIDLSGIDNGSVSHVNTVEGTDTGYTHNVAINEESGYLYRTGGGGHGLRIYDLADPANPSYVTSWDTRYVHDAQIVTYGSGPTAREIAYCCGGFNSGWDDTGLTILDVTDKQNIQVISQVYHPNAEYSHQGWLSEDRHYFYLGDELDEDGSIFTRTLVYDVSDPDNAFYVGAFSNQSRAIGHNMYTRNGKLFQANYRSGLRVFDLDASATSPPEVAWFDTNASDDSADFGGSWSNYPYLPSEIILLSDREQGLFVLKLEDDSVGKKFCSPAATNSTGLPGMLFAAGSVAIADEDLRLLATQLPVGELAVLTTSTTRGGAALLQGGSIGLCIGAPFASFVALAGQSDGAGEISFTPDLGDFPTMTGPVAVQPGETWGFQTTYRDGASTLFTDAVSITFQ